MLSHDHKSLMSGEVENLINFYLRRRLTIKGINNAQDKKNECMFEKKLGKTLKTRYYITINSEGSGLIVRSSCSA